jgi:hypothetical protein
MGTGQRLLVVTETTEFPVQPGMTVTAEPGQKFVIIEFRPEDAEQITATDPTDGQPVTFKLDLGAQPSSEVTVKAIFTVKVTTGGETYYLPTLPCTTDLADVPELTLSFLAGDTPLLDDVEQMAIDNADMACDGKVYDLRTNPQPIYRLVVPGLAVDR